MSDRVERRLWIAAAPQDIWDVIVGDGWLAEVVVLDLNPGGDAEFRTGGSVRSGWVEEARVSPEGGRLAFWWATDDEPATRVEFVLERARGRDDVDGTDVRIVESRPLDRLDLIATPLPGSAGKTYGPALLAA